MKELKDVFRKIMKDKSKNTFGGGGGGGNGATP